MPWMKFQVEPVFLSRKPLPPDKHIYELQAMNNHTCIGLIRQMSSLLAISSKIFDELQEESLRITLRTQRLVERVKTFDEKVLSKLDAKKERLPSLYSKDVHLRQYLEEKKGDTSIKLGNGVTRVVSTRSSSYNIRRTLRKEYLHEDDDESVFDEERGHRSTTNHYSRLDQEDDDEDDGFERTSSQATSSKTGGNTTTINSRSVGTLSQDSSTISWQLPSPKTRMTTLSQEFHPTVIQVDVSEKPFQRMSSSRRSLIHTDFVIKRVKPKRSRSVGSKDRRDKDKRRNTVICGDTTFNNNDSNDVKSSNDTKKIVEKADEAIQTDPMDFCRYLSHEMTSDRMKAMTKQRMNSHLETHLLDRRSGSHVRRSQETAKESRLDRSSCRVSCRGDECPDEGTCHHEHHQTLSSSSGLQESRGTQMSSMRLHSLLTDRLTVKMREQPLPNGMKSAHHHGDDGRSSSGNWSASSSEGNSSTAQNGQPYRSSCNAKSNNNRNLHYATALIHSNPHQEFSRASSNHSIDDKDSVLSDSIIAHADTDTQCEESVNGYTSDTSNMSSINPRSQQQPTTPQTVVNRRRQTSQHSKVQYANRDSECWLQYYEQDSSESTVTPTAESNPGLSSDTETLQDTCSSSETCTESDVMQGNEKKQLQQLNHHNCHRRKHLSSSSCTSRPQRSSRDDNSVAGSGPGEDEESVHSMDTDGYYTSMHTDSGLCRGKTLVMTPNSSFRNKTDGMKRLSVASVGDTGLNSVLSRSDCQTASIPKTTSGRVLPSGKTSTRKSSVPPPPPPRSATTLSSSSTFISSRHDKEETPTSQESLTSRSASHSPSHALNGLSSYASESETSECRTRRRIKTSIDASKYPSMCVVTTSEGSDGSSDAETGNDHAFPKKSTTNGEKKPSKKLMKMKDIFSMKPLDALSRTISKSRESIDEKIKRAFGSLTSSKDYNHHDSNNRAKLAIPPSKFKTWNLPNKSNPSHPLFMLATHNLSGNANNTINNPSSNGNLFTKRNTDRVHPDISAVYLTGIPTFLESPTSKEGKDDPFSRLFPIKHHLLPTSKMSKKPLRIEYLHTPFMDINSCQDKSQESSTRPNSLDLKKTNGISSENDKDLEKTELELIQSLARKEDGQNGMIYNEKMEVMTPDTEDDDGYDFLKEIMDAVAVPEKKKLTENAMTSVMLSEKKVHHQLNNVFNKIDLTSSFSAGSTSTPIHYNNNRNSNDFEQRKQVMTRTPLEDYTSPGLLLLPQQSQSPTSVLETTDKLLSNLHESSSPQFNNNKALLKLDLITPDLESSPPTLIRGGFLGGSMTRGRSLTPNSFGIPFSPMTPSPSSSRRSWAGTPAEFLNVTPKKSPWEAIKTTSREDFLRLLSQKTFSSKVISPVGQRKSAAEILNVSPKQSPVTPPSPLRSIGNLFQNHNSPQTPTSLESSVPLVVPASTPNSKTRVINGRIYRAPYSLQKMYPPIEESTEESLNKSREQVSSCLSVSLDKSTTSMELNSSDEVTSSPEIYPINGRNSTNTWV